MGFPAKELNVMENRQAPQGRIHGKFTKKLFPYLLMAPTLVLILIFLIVPLVFALYCSLYRCDYMQFSKFLGFQNYADVLSDKIF